MWWASAIIIWCSAVAADDLAVSDSSSFVANTNEGVQQPIQLVRPDGNGGLEVVPEVSAGGCAHDTAHLH